MKSKRRLKEESLEILKELETKSFTVVSTALDNKPHSANITYIISGTFLYFITNEDSRKAKNILINPNVSLVVTEKSNTPISIQIQGRAKIVTDKEESIRALSNFTKVWYTVDYAPPVLNIPNDKTIMIKVDMKSIQWFQTAEKLEKTTAKKTEFNYTNKENA